MSEELCQAYAAPHLEEGAAERGSPEKQGGVHGKPRRAWSPARGSVQMESSSNGGASFLPSQGRALTERLDSIRVVQKLAACRLHSAHGQA